MKFFEIIAFFLIITGSVTLMFFFSNVHAQEFPQDPNQFTDGGAGGQLTPNQWTGQPPIIITPEEREGYLKAAAKFAEDGLGVDNWFSLLALITLCTTLIGGLWIIFGRRIEMNDLKKKVEDQEDFISKLKTVLDKKDLELQKRDNEMIGRVRTILEKVGKVANAKVMNGQFDALCEKISYLVDKEKEKEQENNGQNV